MLIATTHGLAVHTMYLAFIISARVRGQSYVHLSVCITCLKLTADRSENQELSVVKSSVGASEYPLARFSFIDQVLVDTHVRMLTT